MAQVNREKDNSGLLRRQLEALQQDTQARVGQLEEELAECRRRLQGQEGRPRSCSKCSLEPLK
jgi:hypothetical protein